MEEQAATSARERRTAVLLFVSTTLCVFFVYATQHAGGDPFADPQVAWESAQFAGALMAILLAHEMGHYLVARRHGFALSLPYFLPLPFAFGTFGAIIRLRSMPRSRTALLEMGAAGPIAGFVVAMIALALGASHVTPMDGPVIMVPAVQAAASDPGVLDGILVPILNGLAWLLSPLELLFPAPPPGTEVLGIMANPPAMDLLGLLVSGRIPGRYDLLDPLSMAGWVGCLITGINLLPIGQLDGGHVLNALAPRLAGTVAKALLVLAFLASVLWAGWAVWAILLLALRAWISLPVPEEPPPSSRARVAALLALGAFLLCFMPRPFEMEEVPRDQIRFVHEDGVPLTPSEVEALGIWDQPADEAALSGDLP